MKRASTSLAALLVLGAALGACSPSRGGFGAGPTPSTSSPAPAHSPTTPDPSPAVISVRSAGMAFDPPELDLEAGAPVILELENPDDVAHVLAVNELSILLRAEPGETVRLPFTPGEEGAFDMVCTIPGHREAGHTGTLRVG